MFRLAIECGGGAPVVTARGVTLHDADLFEFKRNTATFVCKCPGSPDNHIVTRKAPPGVLHTSTGGDHRTMVLIEGTKFKLAIPDTINLSSYGNTGFEFGGIRFKPKIVNHRVVSLSPSKPLPESWTIDIGESYEVL